MESCAEKVVITFHSHYDATRQKKKYEKKGVSCRLIPVPRSLSSSCGTALILDECDYDATALIDDIEGVFLGKGDDKWSGLPIA